MDNFNNCIAELIDTKNYTIDHISDDRGKKVTAWVFDQAVAIVAKWREEHRKKLEKEFEQLKVMEVNRSE